MAKPWLTDLKGRQGRVLRILRARLPQACRELDHWYNGGALSETSLLRRMRRYVVADSRRMAVVTKMVEVLAVEKVAKT